MTPEELERALRAFNRRRPFQTFWIELSNGRRIRVVHPEAVRREGSLFVYLGPTFRSYVFSAAGVNVILDPPPAGG